MRRICIALTMIAGMSLLGEGSYLTVKSKIAQKLIISSWESRDQDTLPDVPWPWADTKVVAKISFIGSGESQMVMQDANGESLAFGPGLVTRPRAATGPLVIAGHRDTHFSHLKEVESGEVIDVELWNGKTQRFQVTHSQVINAETDSLQVSQDDTTLTLITCWPFDALVPGGPHRYIVTADLIG